MCLIGFAWHASAEYPFALVANRDEFHARPTEKLHWWPDAPIAAGRDKQAGGTWLGINKSGRFAAITNYRNGRENRVFPVSRGTVVTDILTSTQSLEQIQNLVDEKKENVGGFNLLYGDLFGADKELRFTSNRNTETQIVGPGIYSFSNGPFEASWPKTDVTKQRLTRALRHRSPSEFWKVLEDTDKADPDALPDTGIDPNLEEFLSSVFIVGDDYGTRSSHRILCRQHTELTLAERTFNPKGQLVGAANIKIHQSE